jgi:cell division protein FtsQ
VRLRRVGRSAAAARVRVRSFGTGLAARADGRGAHAQRQAAGTDDRQPRAGRRVRGVDGRASGVDGIDPRIRQRRDAVERSRGRRRRIATMAMASVPVLGLVGWFVLHASFLSADVITVDGAVHTSPNQVVGAAALTGHPPLIDVSPGVAASRIEGLPWVLRATVSRRWPDGVAITVVERQPVASVQTGPSGWALVDRSGRVLQRMTAAQSGLPVLAVTPKPGAAGSFLRAPASAGLAVSASLPLAFAAQVTTVGAQNAAAIRLQMTTPITVLLGDAAQLHQKYADVASILEHAILHPGDTIDVSVPSSPVVAGP